MDRIRLLEILYSNLKNWTQPAIGGDIEYGDMPGDRVNIAQAQINNANVLFPRLIKEVAHILEDVKNNKIVISVCGGSGCGKSGMASLISYYFKNIGIKSYVLSGDNYPHRIPEYNDAERLAIFRKSGIKRMIEDGVYSKDIHDTLIKYQEDFTEADEEYKNKHSWYSSYLEGGISGLEGYLGTDKELDFDELNNIISLFKDDNKNIYLKRMGRTATQLWYENIDFSDINILIIEWTHGNSDYLKGVDIPILLNSTPKETLEYRKLRNRDGNIDSPFTKIVLEIEQKKLHEQAKKARIILSKAGEILSYKEYEELMKDKI